VGRKRIQIDFEEVERLAGQGLTNNEIAYALRIAPSTLYERQKESSEFSEAIKRGRAQGAREVSNALMEQCRQGNTAAIIWYEKTRRGLSEHSELVKRIEELERIARSNGHQKEIGRA
jgi:DNA invertase Pin-like site-specific DNA recombinase